MTLSEFQALVATLPEAIDRVHFWGLNASLPRLAWWEARIEQAYASNGACVERTIVVLEYTTEQENDPHVRLIIDTLRGVKMPFVCEIENDEEQGKIVYTFNVWLEEDL